MLYGAGFFLLDKLPVSDVRSECATVASKVGLGLRALDKGRGTTRQVSTLDIRISTYMQHAILKKQCINTSTYIYIYMYICSYTSIIRFVAEELQGFKD